MAKKLAKFNSSKHPRGHHGRFTQTPDQPKLSSSQLGKARVHGTDSGDKRSLILSQLTPAQKTRLFHTIVARDPHLSAIYNKLNSAQQARLIQAFHNGKTNLHTRAGSDDKPTTDTATTAAQPKRTQLTPEEKAAKEAEKAKVKADKEAERARKQAEKEAVKAVKEAEKQAKAEEAAKQDKSARSKVADLLKKMNKIEATEEVPSYRLNTKGLPKTPQKQTLRHPVSKSVVEFSDRGVEIWKGQPELGKHTGNWKVHKQTGFDYGVEHQGKHVSINKNETWVEFEQERVRGIPNERQHYHQMSDEQLLRTFATYTMHVENHVDRSIDAPAAGWVASRHGTIPDELRLNKEGKLIPYGGMDIHHHIQWAKVRFDTITNRYKAGEIDLETAKREMGELVEKVTVTDKNGKPKEVWQIKIPDKPEDRELVLLPEGGHNVVNPKMYELLHPKGIHPETGELKSFGVPDAGEWGRETWFNKWNKRFWANYYRREVYQVRNEINRRVRSGELTPEQAESHWQAGVRSTQDWHDKTKTDNNLVEARKKAIYQDFLGDRKRLKK